MKLMSTLASRLILFTMSLIGSAVVQVRALTDYVIDRVTLTFDALIPMRPDVAAAVTAGAFTGPEVRYLTQGIHRRAQPRSHRIDPNDPDDGDDGNDMRDNGLRESMRC